MSTTFLSRKYAALALICSSLVSASVCAAEDSAAFNALHQIQAGDLNIGYVDIGPRDGQAVILLHGWPYDIHSYAAVAPALARLLPTAPGRAAAAGRGRKGGSRISSDPVA